MVLGKLEKCRVRDVWSKESDFSDWLFEKKNIDLLTETLGLDEIQTNQREDNIGSFSSDITGETIASGKGVVIENQLEQSNHDHLGKIITYGAGKDAEVIIWIVEKAREEHASAIAWLNSNLVPGKGFFLVEIELWKIGGSEMAPKFNIVEKPNEWAKVEKSSRVDEESLGAKLRLSFWQEFIDYAVNDKELLKEFPGTHTKKTTADHYFALSKKNCKGFQMWAMVYTDGGTITGVGMWIALDAHQERYEDVLRKKKQIEEESGLTFEWPDIENERKFPRIKYRKGFPSDTDNEEYFKWLSHNLIAVKKAFNKHSVKNPD